MGSSTSKVYSALPRAAETTDGSGDLQGMSHWPDLVLGLRHWTGALQVSLPAKVPVLSSRTCQSCCISEWFILASFHYSFSLNAPILLSPLSLQIIAPKLGFWTCWWGVHSATSSFLSSNFFRLALYPQKGIALQWHSFSMTDPSALTSHLLSSLLVSLGFSPFPSLWLTEVSEFVLWYCCWSEHSIPPSPWITSYFQGVEFESPFRIWTHVSVEINAQHLQNALQPVQIWGCCRVLFQVGSVFLFIQFFFLICVDKLESGQTVVLELSCRLTQKSDVTVKSYK